MRIAMLGHKRIPSREGGVEIVVEELATRMVNEGHSVTVYNRFGKHLGDKNIDNSNTRLKKYKGINIKQVFTINKRGINALVYSVFASIRATFAKYDVIHYHAEGSCAMLWIPKFFSKKKIVVTVHGLDWQRGKWGRFASKYILFGEKIAVKYADEIIVLSENIQNYFKEKYNRDCRLIPNGVNKPEILEQNDIKEKYNLEKEKYILFLARIVPEKGLDYLIDAYMSIDTDIKLVIAGGSSHTNKYFNQVKEKVLKDSRIIMTGFVEGRELQELFSDCYIYILPSDIEGMPLSLLEAMSYGKNVIVSNIPENMMVIGSYGYYFEKSNTEQLKEILEQLINNKLLLKDSCEISSYILNKYNWNDVVEKTLELYK